MVPNRACPILFRDSAFSRILVFRHPLAGIQLVKGRIEDGEKPVDAAIRELCEESGICDAKADRDFGLWRSGFENQVWSFHLCSTPHALPESWVHHARDDGGLDLRFYWHSVNQPPNEEWPPLFQRALRHILNCVEGRR